MSCSRLGAISAACDSVLGGAAYSEKSPGAPNQQNLIFLIYRNFHLRRRAKQRFIRCLVIAMGASIVNDDTSLDLSRIAKLNGDFRRNYGKLLGAFLYLRSISAARGRSWFWASLISLVFSAAMTFLGKHSLPSLVAW